MSRRPGYENTSGIGYDYESRREAMLHGHAAGIGRRPAKAPAYARGDDGQVDIALLQLRLRLLELQP